MTIEYRKGTYKDTIKSLYQEYYGGDNKRDKEVVIEHKNGKIGLTTKKQLVSELKKFKAKYTFTLPYGDLVLYIKAYQNNDKDAIEVFAKRGKELYLKYNKK